MRLALERIRWLCWWLRLPWYGRFLMRLVLWAIAAFVFGMLAGLVAVRVAEAAVWQRVVFITPGAGADSAGQVARIIGQRWNAPGPWAPANLWRGPGTSFGALSTAKAPGALDTAWVSTTQDPMQWRRGGAALRLAHVTAAGDTGVWSNYQLTAAGVPADTLFLDASTRLGLVYRRTLPNPISPTIWEVTFVRDPGDTILVAPPMWPELNGKGPIVHFEDFELALRCRICPTYHYLVRRGARDSSLCIGPCP